MENNGAINPKTLDQYISEGKDLQPVGVRMKGSEVMEILLSDGSRVSRDRAVAIAKEGLMPGYTTGVSSTGDEYLKGMPDGDPSNNLQNLPTF